MAAFDERVAFYAAVRTILLIKIDSVSLASYLGEQKADNLVADAETFEKMLAEVYRRPAQFGLVLARNLIGNDRMLLFMVS